MRQNLLTQIFRRLLELIGEIRRGVLPLRYDVVRWNEPIRSGKALFSNFDQERLRNRRVGARISAGISLPDAT